MGNEDADFRPSSGIDRARWTPPDTGQHHRPQASVVFEECLAIESGQSVLLQMKCRHDTDQIPLDSGLSFKSTGYVEVERGGHQGKILVTYHKTGRLFCAQSR